GGQHLGVLRARPAGDHQRVVRRAVLAVERDAAQVEHRQEVRVADLVLEAEADQVEAAEWSECFEGIQGEAVGAEQLVGVGRGGVTSGSSVLRVSLSSLLIMTCLPNEPAGAALGHLGIMPNPAGKGTPAALAIIMTRSAPPAAITPRGFNDASQPGQAGPEG